MTIDPTIALDITNALPTTDPAITTGTDDTYIPSYPMPPSPTAEPFIPASTPSVTAPTTPRDRAYTLHLQGYRSPAIAAHLGVPECTICHWIQLTNQDINELPALADLAVTPDSTNPDQPATEPTPTATTPTASTPAPLTTLQHQRTLAIERHCARAAAAWALHDQLRATLDPFLARLSERLLLHTQYPDDADHVSMSTLELAGDPLSPAFRAMYHMLPGIINGLTCSLALAERADLQIDRLQGIIPPATQAPTPKASSKQPGQEAPTPMPTREEIERAVEAERIAKEDAYVIPRLTKRQRDLIRVYVALPEMLSDGPIETWKIKIDPNAPLTRWREVLLPHKRYCADSDDPDDDPDPTPPSGTTGTRGKPSSKRGTPSSQRGAASGKWGALSRKDARNHSGNSGKNSGNKMGNASGNLTGTTTGHLRGTRARATIQT